MKVRLNNKIKVAKKSKKKIDEEFLFEAMSEILNDKSYCESIFVKKIHKSYVLYESVYDTNSKTKIELGDLLFIIYDEAKKSIRICTLQAKYKPTTCRKFLSFNGDLFQWELLTRRTKIENIGKSNFFEDILQFNNDYKSITAYGIFYLDSINNEVDFLYTIPEKICIKNIPKLKKTTSKRHAKKTFRYTCGIGEGSPCKTCKKGFCSNETIFLCSIDVFEDQILSSRIGAPIIPHENFWDYLKMLKYTNPDNSTIDKIFSDYGVKFDNADLSLMQKSFITTLLVVTDSNKHIICKNEIDNLNHL